MCLVFPLEGSDRIKKFRIRYVLLLGGHSDIQISFLKQNLNSYNGSGDKHHM